MTIWWALALWLGAGLLIAIGMAIGSSFGYRRGWEDHRSAVKALDAAPSDGEPVHVPSGDR